MNDKIIRLEETKGVKLPKRNDGGNGGGGNMSYVSQDTFNQYEKRIDGRLENIDDSVKENKKVLMWAVGLSATTLVAVVIGFITVIFNLI